MPVPAPPAGVDQPAQAAEELRRALDLVEDDQLVLVLRQVQFRLGEFGPVGFGLQVEVDRRPRLGDFERERGLPDLPRPQQSGGRRFLEGGGKRCEQAAMDHPCNYGVTFQKCKDNLVPNKWNYGKSLFPDIGVPR